MSRIFITGSSDGLGLLAGRRLADEGHEVMLHARSQPRAQETTEKVANAAGVLVGDLSRIADTRQVAEEANASGRFDAVIHNAGIGYREPRWNDVLSNALEPGWVSTKMGRPRRTGRSGVGHRHPVLAGDLR
jgi:NAD(P)-dependent dehydrogenase (short-subunit alcohol dehydrogenase family)